MISEIILFILACWVVSKVIQYIHDYMVLTEISKMVKHQHPKPIKPTVSVKPTIQSKIRPDKKKNGVDRFISLFKRKHKVIQNDSIICIVCMDRKIDTVLYPCRHMELCSTCANKLQECGTCRQSIDNRIQVFSPFN